MSIKKFSMLLLSAMSMAALISGCGSSSKEGASLPADVAKVNEATCRVCHAASTDPLSGENILSGYLGSPHNSDAAGCQGCHGGGAQHNGVGPIPFPSPVDRCNVCHTGTNTAFGNDADIKAQHVGTYLIVPTSVANPGDCGICHNPHDPINAPFVGGSCVVCHALPQDRGVEYVQDNNGVRSITQEFGKWSHHVTGVKLNDAHCAACHLEGRVVNGKIVVDTAKHMADAKTHLRHADNDSDFAWDPAAPNHTNMDNFCMSCHDANGATSPASVAIQTFINANGLAAAGKTASASNPFGDTISNRYDKMLRPKVVDVDSQFYAGTGPNTGNNSHHGVKGPRYTGRTRAAGPRQITDAAKFDDNSSATLWGKRSTIYDSVNAITGVSELATNPAFTSLYTPLENAGGEAAPRTGAATLGDDSTLHCGDCHTVGQWKAGSAKNADGSATTAAIGAHGSNNEYMLRNDKGTDVRHTQDAYLKGNATGTVLNPTTGLPIPNGSIVVVNPNGAFLVCFNCHSYKRYGSIYNATGATGPHAGEYDAEGRCNGVGNTIPFNGYTTGTATDGTKFLSRIGEFTRAQAATTPAFAPGWPLDVANAPPAAGGGLYVGEQNADFGNIFGIQCLNCHNSGIGNGYGGIHGSANNSLGTVNTGTPAVAAPAGGAYVDGMGNWNKVQRFLPGLGNIMHVPGTLGGFQGGATASTWGAGGTLAAGTLATGTIYTFTKGAIANDSNWEQVGWKQIPGNPTGALNSSAGCYTLNDEGTGSSLDDPNSATYGLKGQPWDGTTTQTPNAAKTWGGCDDHTGTSVGNSDHGFVKRINRPVTY